MRENLLRYPSSCWVGRNIPKTTLVRRLQVPPAMRRRLQDEVLSVEWLYKIAPTTLQLTATPDLPEIEVFLADLRSTACPTDVLAFLDQRLPQYLVFVLRCGEQHCLLVNYKQWADTEHTRFDILQTFRTEWGAADQLALPVSGAELPTVYAGFVRRIAGDRLPTDSTAPLEQEVLTYQRQEALRKLLTQREAAIRRENQPNRKFALHQEILQLKKELDTIWKN